MVSVPTAAGVYDTEHDALSELAGASVHGLPAKLPAPDDENVT
jgi:hypothetical protein